MRQMANLEYSFISCELASLLENARLEKIYELSPLCFRLRFHSRGKESVDVICAPPIRLHATRFIQAAPETPSNFCMFLRKRIEGALLEKIEQHSFDRIILFSFKAREKAYSLIFELFGEGNVLLLDDKGVIEGVYRSEEWKDRKLSKGEKYVFPSSGRASPFQATPAFLAQLASEKPVITILASSINLGAVYLEDALLKAGVQPKKKSSELSKQDWSKISESLKALEGKLLPIVFYKESAPAEYSLVPLAKYSGTDAKFFASFSEALDAFYQSQAESKAAAPSPALSEERARLERQLEDQLAASKDLEVRSLEAKAAGDWIYANYEGIEELLRLAKDRKKNKKEFEQKLASLRGKFNEKTGKILLPA